MENCRKIPSIVTRFYILFLLRHLAITVAGDSLSPYTPKEAIFISCGRSGNIPLNGRTWVGDVNSEYSPLEPQKDSSTIFTNPRETPYSASRLSHSQFTYTLNLTSGQKFIRLHFYSSSYSGFDVSKAFFSVKAGSFTLLSNFSASLTADYLGDIAFFKEFCINVDKDKSLLNITFTPSPDYQDSYAFVAGIEVVSMPPNLYYTAANETGFQFVGPAKEFRVRNSNALETLYRINVGGNFISPSEDTGMCRTWNKDDVYLTDARPSAFPFNYTFDYLKFHKTPVFNFSVIRNYSAPIAVYETGRRMGLNRKANETYVINWEFEVDSGFTYFLRLHFCDFLIAVMRPDDRMFEIYIADRIAETQANVLAWSKESGLVYRDYAVLTGPKGNEKKQRLSIALRPTPPWITNYSNPILNGLEIFKVDNGGNLAAPNPDGNITAPSVAETPNSQSKMSKNNRPSIIAIVAGVASGFVVISLLVLFLRTHFTSKTKPRKSRGSSLASDLCTHFSISEIKVATNNFDNAQIIGVGGFGNVYKGFINSGSTPVAIKRQNPGSEQGALEFETEIEMLSQLIHIHLVTLIGYCNDDGEMILVYDFMARGTLRDHLYNTDNPPLAWNQRLNLCIGAARGLQYLHTSAKQVIIHRDVKTTNILLDEKWVAKVSDFGLSKFGPNSMSKTHVSTVVKGSFGYLDPEYYRLQKLTEKSDVYSFGVVLLEVLCARPPILRTMDENHVSLANWAQQCSQNGTIDEIVDPFLKEKITSECLKKYTEVAISCLNDYGSGRPSMSDVVRGLELAFQLQAGGDENDELGEVELSTIRSGSQSITKDVFSEIMNPQGR